MFSWPIDPTNVMRDWGRSDDDQRHRLVINGSVNTPMTPAATAWQRISHGFQLSGMLQVLLGIAVHITSGLTSLQGTAGRPLANGATTSANFDVRSVEFIPRNAGIGNDFLALNARLSRALRISNGVKLEGLVEAFNLTNRTNNVTRNANFGSGSYPSNPVSTFNQTTAVGDPRTLQFGVRVNVLIVDQQQRRSQSFLTHC